MLNLTTLTGLTIGQYTLKEQLGAGAMGVVYRGFQPTLQREVAIKILQPTLATQEGYLERFTREARTAASLEHAHIVPIHDYGTQQDLSYVVMRLLTGGSLAQRMAQRGKDNLPSPGEVSQMLKEIASALDYAHSQGVVHRDIKAGNIMFDNQGSAYLVDFGIAKLMDNLGLTGSGLAVGTPTHMSPEQWRGEAVTPATDQYALGVVIYEMLTGHLPFESTSAYALMHKHLNEPATPLRKYRSDLPADLENVFQRVLAKDPQDRFPSVTAFAEAFEEAIRGTADHQTGFFSFEVRPMRLKADGELSSSFARSMGGGTSGTSAQTVQDVEKAKRPPLSPEELKQIQAEIDQRINKRKEFYIHAAVFAVLIPAIWLVWLILGMPLGVLLPLIITLGWGSGLAGHAVDVWYSTSGRVRMRERELQREMWRRGLDTGTPAFTEKQKRDAIGRLSDESDDEEEPSVTEQYLWERRSRRRRR